ncbi:MAG TPA: XRE family transcriptional regulator [Longimicrobium sp.]
MTEQTAQIAFRIMTLRKARRINQQTFAAALGLESRRSVAAIESGARRVTPEELVRAADLLGVELEALLDPFRLMGEGRFSFRVRAITDAELSPFEDRAGRWVATYRECVRPLAETGPSGGAKRRIFSAWGGEDVEIACRKLWMAWDLGPAPAERLGQAIEQHVGALILNVDGPEGLSSAVCYLRDYHTIFVNRSAAPERRALDIARALFRLLAWGGLPPRRIECAVAARARVSRGRQLADSFAAALVMPGPLMQARWAARLGEDLRAWMLRTSRALQVSVPVLGARLLELGLVQEEQLGSALEHGAQQQPRVEPRMLFSRMFIAPIADAVNSGRLLVGRAAGILELSPLGFAELCRAYGCPLRDGVPM